MVVEVLGLIFLFIIRIRFPKGKSIANIIRSRYGEAFVRKIRKFEKNNHKLRKSHLDLRFLLEYKKNNLIPKFLQFKLANRHRHNSVVYKKCQIKLLEEEINILEKDIKRIKEELQGTVSCLDFSYICSLFLVANDKSILHHDNIQKQKLKKLLEILLKEVINDSHDPNKVIYNFSSYELNDVEKSILCKGLNFSVKPKSIECS